MAVPALSLVSASPLSADADVLVLGVLSGDDGPRLARDDDAFGAISAALASIGTTGAPDELRRLPALIEGAPPIALIGLGGDATVDALRAAAGSAVRQLAGTARVAIALPADDAERAAAVLEGAALGSWSFTTYRSAAKAASAKRPVAEIVVHAASGLDAPALVEHAAAVATAVHTVRDLASTPANDLYPQALAERAQELAAGLPVEVEVLDEAALHEGGFGGILGVGSGSVRPPRLVVVRYRPAGAERRISLVGKGITYDSGGITLKPATGLVGMKYDMTGAAVVLAATLAIARLGLPVEVTARLCVAENMPSGSAMRPNDVLTMFGGGTVEVLNTDAEGRLVLADGLGASADDDPDFILDVATLTGAARVAMGERVTPVMGDDEIVQRVLDAGADAAEPAWAMPIPPELRSILDSDVADIVNSRPGVTTGGMLVAATFLQHFVPTRGDGADARPIPWAHLDIAGVANNSGGPYGFTPKGPTGSTVRTLIALTESLSRKG
ncbi:leucyl aminopeptidase [Pseudolysinimonas kribbensis]|uniref:Probable cytosol aminopeptidase n=1 Tax=Pseudolysinimonas kribbensis TaxID=433641 RepID=A0ABQ6KCE0_9MICO|nr:leucyl aminopeptidase [Pseudolysinimonas kribbensis]GMA96864.1 putative cytosol aminopeptidase [Pseudolysinimonas kribbensis]